MQPQFIERWLVVAGNQKFYLNENQIRIIKEANLKGHRGIIWFDDQGISIPYIQAISLESREPKNCLIESQVYRDLTPEERARSIQALERERKSLEKRGIISKKITEDQQRESKA
jgi:hypothetical protein